MQEAEIIGQLVKQIADGHASMGILGALAAALTVVVRLVRLPLVQQGLGAIDPRLQWASWKKPARLGFVFLLSTLGAVITALASGAGLSIALVISALIGGLGSIALNETTEAVGVAVAPVVPEPIKRTTGLLIPMPRSLDELEAKRREVEASMAERR